MELTRSSFSRNAQILTRALEIDANQQKIDGTSEGGDIFRLCQWRLERNDEKDPCSIYLIHPPVAVVTPHANRSGEAVKNVEQELYEESLLEDDAISVDAHVISTEPAEDPLDATTLWTFSIVYSSTYRAPVLYFHVQSPGGHPCGRQDVLEMLGQWGDGETINDTWEFVSQEEHPFSGYPSFFLHPCQSAHRLQLMTISGSVSGGDDVDESYEETWGTTAIWAWMSMILPAVGHAIPASYYLKIRQCIAELEENG
jgi:hypothetical protein